MSGRSGLACGALVVASLAFGACSQEPVPRRFATADEAARSLIEIVKSGTLDDLLTLFGPEAQEIVASSDPATGRRNRSVFVAAAREQWHLEDLRADAKELVVGNEDWPFPIPIVRDARGWYFDAAAGKEEVLARRIGRNELAAIATCRSYVAAQRAYARTGHDGRPAGLYARKFASDPGKQDGLYWPVKRGEPRSPLGDLVAAAADDGYALEERRRPEPFHGYYFRILTAQGDHAPGGARDYLKDGELSGGFALIAWPARYDATGVMTLLVGADGAIFEKDLGPDTTTAAAAITRFDPDASWRSAAIEVEGRR